MSNRAMAAAFLLILAGLIGPAAAAAADPSLVGYWKFEGDWLDSSGNNRTGVPSGNAQFGPGMDGQGLLLDGSGDYVTITGYQGILGGNPFSIALWARSTSAGDVTMVNWGSSTNGQRVDFRLYQGRLRVEHGNGNLQANTTLNDNEWHYVALTVAAGTGLSAPGVQLYLDGKVDTQATADPDTFNINGVTAVTIGRRGTNSDRAFPGTLDEVRIYDRVLTLDEIKALGAHPKAYAPSPADGALDAGSPLLTWQPRETALWHDVYLGTSPELTAADLVAPRWMAAVYFHVAGFVSGTTYYWRIDEIDPDGTVHPGDVWTFTYSPVEAWQPNPGDGEPFVSPDTTLAWMPGLNAITHDVYLGIDKAAVTDGASDTFKGNQLTTSFAPGALASNTTYYWRIDELSPTGTKVQGNVWSFKTLPPITVTDPNLAGWWTFDEGTGTNVVDWSGHGNHGTLVNKTTWADGYDGTALMFNGSGDMVLMNSYAGVTGIHSRTVTAWIKTANLGEIVSWGLNVAGQKWIFRVQESNGTVGAIRIEVNGGYQVGWTDVRDNEWHHVAAVLDSDGTPDATEIALYLDGWLEPSSASLDEPINTIDTGIVRIGESPWHNRPFTGLMDDVRVYDKALTQAELEDVMRIDPLRAWQPGPANGAVVDIRMATPLMWTKGDSASKHNVYFGTDQAAVAAAEATDTTGVLRSQISAASFTPAESLAWGQKYYWRIDEVNADGSISAGKVWSFTVADYLIVDDFESYTDEDGSRIYQTWIDGLTDGRTNSIVGNAQAPFAERTIVFSGSQAMPLDYNNTTSPYYSEAELEFATAQNWTFGDVNTLVVHFRGQAPAFLESAGTITLSAAGTDIWNTADEFRYVWKRLDGDGSIIARVDSITNTNVWAKGGVMIREGLEPGARHAMMVATPGSGVAFQRRQTNDAASVGTTQAGIVAPRWVKLTRQGNTFTAQHSADGVTWTDITGVASDTIVMGTNVYIGLALTSHAVGVACTAQFSEIKTTGNVTGAWQPAEIGVAHPGNGPAGFYVAVEDSTGKTAVVSHPDPAAATISTWTPWAIPLSDLTGVNATRVKRLYIGVGDRNSPKPGGAGRVYLDDIRISRGAPATPVTP